MATAAASSPPSQSLPIADVRYLWSEVERLKSQVHHLQQSERQTQKTQQRLEAYVSSFVTHAQLEAALSTKISQSTVASSIQSLHGELVGQLDKKADVDELQVLQSTKLDISVYESRTRDLKKFRSALEQSVHDLFAQFALQIEAQVNGKLSIKEFDRIFNPEASDHKAAIETAAARIAHMNSQLESVQEYVQSDHQRQHKLDELTAGLLDLTREHSASRNSIGQLRTSLEAAKEQAHTIAGDTNRARLGFDELGARIGELHSKVDAEFTRQQQLVNTMHNDVSELTRSIQQTAQALAQIQRFTQNTLLKDVDTRLQQINDKMQHALGDAREQQLKLKNLTTQQLSKASERVLQSMERQAEMEARLRSVEATVAHVREDVAAVKGPLMTAARNLREENVAIQEEIRRSQDESRDILIDYKGLLEKDAVSYGHPAVANGGSLTSRPSSFSAAAVSRKHRQQQIHALTARFPVGSRSCSSNNVAERPQTSHGRLDNEMPKSRLRARTAGDNTSATDEPPDCVASTPSGPTPQRPKSEAGPRPKPSLLYTLGAMGSSAVEALHTVAPLDEGELFTFPSTAHFVANRAPQDTQSS